MKVHTQIVRLLLVSPLALLGCGPTGADADATAGDAPVGSTVQYEAFNYDTDPWYLVDLLNNYQFNADALVPSTTIGQTISVPTASRPFSSTYWPMTEDGINARWQGSTIPSPAEKYSSLFLTSTQKTEFTNWISNNHGKNVPGVQSWFGICQGWTASAIMELSPKHSALVKSVKNADGTYSVQTCTSTSTAGCVKFEPGDITGLLAEAYAAADSRFIGYRCDTNPVNFKYDASGRITQPECRSNAGTLFMTATNFIGRAKKAFAINAVNNDEVWNQPAYAYKISTYQTVTAAQAAKLVNPSSTSTTYTYNLDAKAFRRVNMTLTWTVEANPTVGTAPPVSSASGAYEMILELDSYGEVIGGEWIGASKSNHPPFFWAPVAPGAEVPYLDYTLVKAILNASRT